MDCFGNCSSVECDFFGDATRQQKESAHNGDIDRAMRNSPNIDAGSSQTLVLNYHSLDTKLGAGHARRTQTTTASSQDEVVRLLGDRSHGGLCGTEMTRQ
jgi:hypothetical protein